MDVDCRMVDALDDKWLSVPATRIGSIAPTLRTPDRFVLVSRAGKLLRRLDICFFDGEHHLTAEAILWGEWIAVGFGHRAYLVLAGNEQVVELDLNDGKRDASNYFSGFRPQDDYLLIVGGTGLICMQPDGTVRWRNSNLAIDGVVVESATASTIRGRGDWDPPGGFRPFAISASTGRPNG